MNEEDATVSERGAALAGAVLGGALLAAGILLAIFLFASRGGSDSALGILGLTLVSSFSWAAWFLPLWFFAAAYLALVAEPRPPLVFALGASILPFLLLAGLARTLSTRPGTNSFLGIAIDQARSVMAVVLLILFVVASILIAWLSTLFTARDDRVVETGRRPGLSPREAELEVESSDEEGSATIAGRVVNADETSAEGAASSEAATEPQGREGAAPAQVTPAFEFHVPVLREPPKLRSLGELDEAEIATASLEVEVVEATIPEAKLPDAGAAPPPSEEPIPLFFRGAAPDSGAPLTANSESDQEPLGVDPQSLLSIAGAARPIEFTSVPPAPPAHDPDDGAKTAAIARILARKKRPPYSVPVDGLLMTYPDGQYWVVDEKTKRWAEVLRDTLAEFKIEAEVTGIRKGPVITMFEILPAPGVRLSKIGNLSDNIALRLAASSVRIVAPIPGKHAVGIEVPNERRSIVSLREIVESESFVSSRSEIPVALGKDIAGEVQFIDLTQTPHLLIAGATGSGKSVCVNAIILSIIFRRSPEDVRLLLIDPKIVELKLYNGIPHLLTPVITEPKRAFQALTYCICEMERRYAMLDRVGVRDIKSYNRKIKEKALAQEKLPYIVVVIDEFADLMATTGKELESTLARLAAMSRAVGIHLVLATQRPSIDVITGLIKANIPSRIAFMVASKFDSRIIIDMVGAEKLLGRGDMLFASAWDPFPIRMQGAYVSEDEVEKAVEFVKTLGEPEYIDEDIFIDDEEEESEPTLFDDGDGDPLFEQALEIVLRQGKASASYIQRKLKIGYNRAARLVELMEERGIVGPAQGSKPRDLVRNPEIAGLRTSANEVGAGVMKMSLQPLVSKLETAPGEGVATAGAAASGGGIEED